jgi:hypothetical protein
MESEVKELKEARKAVTMRLRNIPSEVHEKLITFQADLTGKHRKSFTLEEAYVEFLKQTTKSI